MYTEKVGNHFDIKTNQQENKIIAKFDKETEKLMFLTSELNLADSLSLANNILLINSMLTEEKQNADNSKKKRKLF